MLHQTSLLRMTLVQFFGLWTGLRVSGRISRSLNCPRFFHEWFPTKWLLFSAKRAFRSKQTGPNLHEGRNRTVGIPNGPRAWPSRTARDGHARVPLFKGPSSLRTNSYFLSFSPLSSLKSLSFLHFRVFWVHGLLKWWSRLFGGASFSWLLHRADEALVDFSWRGWSCQHHWCFW